MVQVARLFTLAPLHSPAARLLPNFLQEDLGRDREREKSVGAFGSGRRGSRSTDLAGLEEPLRAVAKALLLPPRQFPTRGGHALVPAYVRQLPYNLVHGGLLLLLLQEGHHLWRHPLVAHGDLSSKRSAPSALRARLDYLLSSLSHSRLHPRSRCRGVFLGFFLFSGKAEKTRIFWGQSQSTNRVRNAFDRSRGEENHLSLGRRSEGTQTRSAARSSTGTAGTLFRSSHGRGHGHEGAPTQRPPPPPAPLSCCETPPSRSLTLFDALFFERWLALRAPLLR